MESKINLEHIIALILIVVSILGSTVPLHMHTSSQIDAIHQEIKDFHGRLATQDAEFKAHIMHLHGK